MLATCRFAAAIVIPKVTTVLPFSTAARCSPITSTLLQRVQLYRVVPLAALRHFSSVKFSRNLEFFSADNTPIVKTQGSLCVPSSTNGRPLTLLMCWLMSKDSHTKKFVHFYNDLGFDVLKIRISPFDMLRPTRGAQLVATEMLEFLHQNPQHNHVVVHGFSVGAYLFCEGLVQVANDMDRHGPLMDRMVGQIWDSVVSINGIPDGFSKAVTHNKVLQASLKKYLEWFLRTRYAAATVHYERANAKMYEGFLNRPGLFLFSKTDVVSTPAMNASVYDKWEDKGIPVFVKMFDKSPHVSHYHKHKEAYEGQVTSFLERLDLLDGDHCIKKRSKENDCSLTQKADTDHER